MNVVRGATTAENSKESITERSVELYSELLAANGISAEDVTFIIISTTADLTEYYPATAIRLSGCGAPLFSCLEPPIKGSLPHCIRILLASEKPLYNKAYLRGAKDLLERTK